jgi:hypothetical protein
MTKKELWDTYVDLYPQFKDEDNIVKLRSRGLRRLMDHAWDEAYARGREDSRIQESMRRQAEKKKNPFTSNPFSSFFS